MTGLVVCLAGKIGSGKSSLSDALATSLGWTRAGFGDYLRALITDNGGDPNDRRALQELGLTLVSTDARSFCAGLLATTEFLPGNNLLLDGIRHVAVLGVIRALVAPSSTKLIFVAASADNRIDRVSERPGGFQDLPRAESHIVESELSDALPACADLILDADRPFECVLADCTNAIQDWLTGPSSA